jgi:hypothetical protein
MGVVHAPVDADVVEDNENARKRKRKETAHKWNRDTLLPCRIRRRRGRT